MNRRKTKKPLLIMFILMIGLLFPTVVLAEQSHTITIDGSSYAKSEAYHEIIGRKFHVWMVSTDRLSEDASLSKAKELETKTASSLTTMYGNPLLTEALDKEGLVKVTLTKKGTYYAREEESLGKKILSPFTFTIPLRDGSDRILLKLAVPPVKPPRGSFNFLKIADDKKETPLQGATFKVSKKVGTSYQTLQRDKKDYLLTSDRQGRFTAANLPYGTYYLWEVKAPSGYRLLSQPIAFVVDSQSAVNKVIKIINTKNPPVTIPNTGDVILVLLLIGGGLLGTLGYLLVRSQASQEEC